MQGKTVSAKAPAVTSFFNLNSLQKFDDDIPSPNVQNTAAASKPAIDTPVLQKSEESISSRFSTDSTTAGIFGSGSLAILEPVVVPASSGLFTSISAREKRTELSNKTSDPPKSHGKGISSSMTPEYSVPIVVDDDWEPAPKELTILPAEDQKSEEWDFDDNNGDNKKVELGPIQETYSMLNDKAEMLIGVTQVTASEADIVTAISSTVQNDMLTPFWPVLAQEEILSASDLLSLTPEKLDRFDDETEVTRPLSEIITMSVDAGIPKPESYQLEPLSSLISSPFTDECSKQDVEAQAIAPSVHALFTHVTESQSIHDTSILEIQSPHSQESRLLSNFEALHPFPNSSDTFIQSESSESDYVQIPEQSFVENELVETSTATESDDMEDIYVDDDDMYDDEDEEEYFEGDDNEGADAKATPAEISATHLASNGIILDIDDPPNQSESSLPIESISSQNMLAFSEPEPELYLKELNDVRDSEKIEKQGITPTLVHPNFDEPIQEGQTLNEFSPLIVQNVDSVSETKIVRMLSGSTTHSKDTPQKNVFDDNGPVLAPIASSLCEHVMSDTEPPPSQPETARAVPIHEHHEWDDVQRSSDADFKQSAPEQGQQEGEEELVNSALSAGVLNATLESELDMVLLDSGATTPEPLSDFSAFYGPSPTPVASSLFDYMMSAAPFSDPIETIESGQKKKAEMLRNPKTSSSVLDPDDNRLERISIDSEIVITETDAIISLVSGQNMNPVTVSDTYATGMQDHAEYQEDQTKYNQQIKTTISSLNHNRCIAERDGLSGRFMAKLREKEEQLQEIMRINEGMELQLDGLRRELVGTRDHLTEKEKSFSSVTTACNREKQSLEQKMKEIRESEGVAKADIYQLREQLKNARAELESSDEAYGTLKARVKVVATELKDRRAECRTLGLSLMDMTGAKVQLQSKLTHLESQLGDRDRNQTEKDEEMDLLRDKIKELEVELKEADNKIQQRGLVGEKALAAYKKKAQNLLSVANAKIAAAIQAKEEAEMDAQGARTAADEAINRAKDAEADGKSALLEAREYVKEMEEERSELVRKAQKALDDLEMVTKTSAEYKVLLDATSYSNEKLTLDFDDLQSSLQMERARTSELQQEISDVQQRSNDLYDEVEILRDELRRKATAAFMAKSQSGGEFNESGTNGGSKAILTLAETSEAESTIIMLQRELKDANQAIKELKETLRGTIEQKSQRSACINGPEIGTSPGQGTGPEVKPAGAPLFYAMEKQVELNTARSEINRLANLLGDAQSEKMESYESMQEMRKSMELAEARLRRYEKLGPSKTRTPKVSAQYSKYAPHRSISPKRRMSGGSAGSSEDMMDGIENNSASVNLEYLKNVMMSFFNAKTLAEKKALMPVLGSVLCLTPEEHHRAIVSVENSGSLENTGISLFENVGAQLGFKLI